MRKVLIKVLCFILALSFIMPCFIQKSSAYVYGQTDYYGTITDARYGTKEKLFSFFSSNGYYQYTSDTDNSKYEKITQVTMEFPIIMSTSGKTRLDTGKDEDYSFVMRFNWGCKIYIDGNVIYDIPETNESKTIAINLTENTKTYNEKIESIFTERLSDGSHTFYLEYNQPQGKVNNLVIIQTFPNSWIEAKHYDVMTREKIYKNVIYAAEAEGVYIDIHPTEIEGYAHTSGNLNYIYPNVPAMNGGNHLDIYYDYVGKNEEEEKKEEIIDPVINTPEINEEENNNGEYNNSEENNNEESNNEEIKEDTNQNENNEEDNRKDEESNEENNKNNTNKFGSIEEDTPIKKEKETTIKEKDDVKSSNKEKVNEDKETVGEKIAKELQKAKEEKQNKTLGDVIIEVEKERLAEGEEVSDITYKVAERVDNLMEERRLQRIEDLAAGVPEEEATKASIKSSEIDAIRQNIIAENVYKIAEEESENKKANEIFNETISDENQVVYVNQKSNSPSIVGVILTLGLLIFIIIFIIYLIKETNKEDKENDEIEETEKENEKYNIEKNK